MAGTANECDRLSGNKNVVSMMKLEKPMTDTDYNQIEMEQEGMKVILEFPSKSENEESIKQEIKGILSSVLQEQLEKIS